MSVDEISKPAGRWRLLRDEPQFRSTLNEIKNRQNIRPDRSQEVTATGGTFTKTDDVTASIFGYANADKLLESTPKKDILPDSRDLIKSYASEIDPRLQKQAKSTNQNKIWLGLTMVLLAATVLVVELSSRSRDATVAAKDSAFQNLMQNGLRAEKIGDYQKAISLFNEAKAYRPQDGELLLHLGPLTLVHDKQLLSAQRMFKEMLEVERGANYQKAGYLGLGLIALEEQQLDVAEENFTKARSFDPTYVPAIANLSVTAFFKNDLNRAEALLLEALDKGQTDGALVISMADIAMAQKSSNVTNSKLRSVHSLLDGYLTLAVTRDYQQEVLLQDARVLSLMGDRSAAAKRIEAFLDVDPEQTDLYSRDWGIYRGRASWGLMLENLKKTASELGTTARLTAALGLAMYRGREKLDGAQSIEQALSQAPQDPLLLSLSGWIDDQLGKRDTALVKIEQAVANPGKYKLPHVLKARFCFEDKNLDCAKKHWTQILTLDPKSIEAFHGLALVEWKNKNTSSASRWFSEGQAMAPNYIPLLILGQEMQVPRTVRKK